MKQTSNKDMLNAIRNQASEEYKEKIPVVMNEAEARGLKDTIDDYPTIKNEFITTLVDKVVKTDFFSRVYENPLKMLKKGSMPYGGSIEELFVRHADAKGFFKEYTQSGSTYLKNNQKLGNLDSDALLGYKKADVKSLYITKNFAYVFDVSISDAQLKSAFTSQNGLSELVNQLVGSLTSGAELQEYEDMKSLLIAAAAGVKLNPKDATGILANDKKSIESQSTNCLSKNDGFQPMKTITVKESAEAHSDNSYSHGLAIELRAIAKRLKFMSEKYNMAAVKTFSSIDDLVFLTTPERMAQMDVEVLAQAFNISKAEANLRTIVVDELPRQFATTLGTSTSTKPTAYLRPKNRPSDTPVSTDNRTDCLGILIDKNFLQVIDTVNESRQFENGRALMTNIFLHKQGIMANCYFANAIAFVGEYALPVQS